MNWRQISRPSWPDNNQVQRLRSKMRQHPEIVLIGPFDVGKTTLGRLVGAEIGMPMISLDDVCYDYYKEIGWSGDEARRIYEEDGADSFKEYTESFEPYGVEQILLRSRGFVIDLGGGQTVPDNPNYFRRIQDALAPYRNVVLLLPSRDPDECVRVLKTRRSTGSPDYPEYLIQSPCYRASAKHTIYTETMSPEQVRDEVLRRTISA